MFNKSIIIAASFLLFVNVSFANPQKKTDDVSEFSTQEITKLIVSCAKETKDHQFEVLKCGCFIDAARFKKLNAESKALCSIRVREWLDNDEKNLTNVFAPSEWPSSVIAEAQVNCFMALQKMKYEGDSVTACSCVGDGVRRTITYAERLKMESDLGDAEAQKKFLDTISFLYERCIKIK